MQIERREMVTRTLEQAALLIYAGAIRLSDHHQQRNGMQFITLADAEEAILNQDARVLRHILHDKVIAYEIAVRIVDDNEIRVMIVFNNLHPNMSTELVVVDATVLQRGAPWVLGEWNGR